MRCSRPCRNCRRRNSQLRFDRLLQSGLVSRQGEPPYASYLFKHALVQDAAYSTLLREPRRALHARIARVLEGQFPEIGESQPEKLSHHCIEAGQIEKAVEYALAAARRAATRSAMEEAVSQARKGIELVSRLRDGPTRHAQELELQVILGDSLQATRGYSAPEAGEAHVGITFEDDETAGPGLSGLSASPPKLSRRPRQSAPRSSWSFDNAIWGGPKGRYVARLKLILRIFTSHGLSE
jgi:hypothetical protein